MKVNYWVKFEADQYYHIYNRGVNGVNLFYKTENYHYFLRKWLHYVHPFMRIYAYCMMPNHFHFVASPNFDAILNFDFEKHKENEVLCKRVQKVQAAEISFNDFLELQFKDYFGSYSKAINKQESRTGSLFQQRFKRVLLLDEYALLEKICYTHHNPIHHGFCEHYKDWNYSSYLRFLNEKDTILERDFVLNLGMEISKFTDTQVTDTFEVSVTSASVTSASTSGFIDIHETYRQKPLKDFDEF